MSNLDKLLRHDAHLDLADDGFAARVMAGLPARAPRERTWLKPALVMGSAAIGSALAVALSPQGAALVAGFQDLMHLRMGSQGAVSGLALCGALLLSALVLATDSE
jgi:hypothetical protein